LTTCDRDTRIENFAADLAEAAFPGMLKHGTADHSLDLELGHWKVLKEPMKK
jgi:hypothetical protein